MGNPKLKATGINHVVLHVADLDRSQTFYMEVLGFEDRGIVFNGPEGMRASFLRCESLSIVVDEICRSGGDGPGVLLDFGVLVTPFL